MSMLSSARNFLACCQVSSAALISASRFCVSQVKPVFITAKGTSNFSSKLRSPQSQPPLINCSNSGFHTVTNGSCHYVPKPDVDLPLPLPVITCRYTSFGPARLLHAHQPFLSSFCWRCLMWLLSLSTDTFGLPVKSNKFQFSYLRCFSQIFASREFAALLGAHQRQWLRRPVMG